jgi:hypothetical protein
VAEAPVTFASGQIPPDVAAREALWRDRLAERRLLLVLDDAADSEQLRPLLPGTGGSLVLITSRRHLSALDDAKTISLDTLPAAEPSPAAVTHDPGTVAFQILAARTARADRADADARCWTRASSDSRSPPRIS